MQLTTATSGISLAEQHAANMLADSAAFRTWCGVSTAAQARQRIYFDALPVPPGDQAVLTKDDLVALRPFALLFTAEQNGYRRRKIAVNCFVESGQVVLQLEANIPTPLLDNRAEALRLFKNSLGAMLDEWEPLTDQAGYLSITMFDVQTLALEAEDAIPQHGDNIFAILNLPWGANE